VPDLSQATWRKSSRSGQENQCVEVALNVRDVAAIRDSKDPHGPVLVLSPPQFTTFMSIIKDGRLDG
jgi:hypothetical protein